MKKRKWTVTVTHGESYSLFYVLNPTGYTSMSFRSSNTNRETVYSFEAWLNIPPRLRDLRVYKVGKRRCLAHPTCIDGFKQDRKAGLSYGLHQVSVAVGRNITMWDREEWSLCTWSCAYCGQKDSRADHYNIEDNDRVNSTHH